MGNLSCLEFIMLHAFYLHETLLCAFFNDITTDALYPLKNSYIVLSRALCIAINQSGAK